MLPIIRTPSAVSCPEVSKKLMPVQAAAAEDEALAGEWQRSRSRHSRARPGRVFDGEVYSDYSAVRDYLSAAGELPVIPIGHILSVLA